MIFAAMTAMFTLTAFAMDFTISPEFPENQRDMDNGFYDLMVYPGQVQDIYLTVRNERSHDIVVRIERINATSGSGGHINYGNRFAQMDETLLHSFEDMAVLQNEYETIAADSSIRVPIRLNIPAEPFDGAILGSIRVTREITPEEIAASNDQGGVFLNQFASFTAVRLVQSEDFANLTPDFLLREVSVETANRRASITANIRNPVPLLVRGASITGTVHNLENNQLYFEQSFSSAEFAPSSIFPLRMVDDDGYGLEAGDYRVAIAIEFEGQTWNFEEYVTIEQSLADEINKSAVNLTGKERTFSFWDTIPTWLLIVISVIVILALVLIISIIRKQKSIDINALLSEYEKQKASG